MNDEFSKRIGKKVGQFFVDKGVECAVKPGEGPGALRIHKKTNKGVLFAHIVLTISNVPHKKSCFVKISAQPISRIVDGKPIFRNFIGKKIDGEMMRVLGVLNSLEEITGKFLTRPHPLAQAGQNTFPVHLLHNFALSTNDVSDQSLVDSILFNYTLVESSLIRARADISSHLC